MNQIKVSCEAYIVREGKLLLGKRGQKAKGPWQGTWALPGGHVELQERADTCIIRELEEELAVEVAPEDVKLIALVDGLNPERGQQDPQRNEPDMCEEWRWFPVDALPENIFPPHKPILETIHTGQVYC